VASSVSGEISPKKLLILHKGSPPRARGKNLIAATMREAKARMLCSKGLPVLVFRGLCGFLALNLTRMWGGHRRVGRLLIEEAVHCCGAKS